MPEMMSTLDSNTTVPAAKERIAVINCLRPAITVDDSRRVIGVRWASRPALGYPPSGYTVRRMTMVNAEYISAPLGNFTLPASGSWAAFLTDAQARRPARGPYFEAAGLTEENFGYLLPIVRLADPRTPAVELPVLTRTFAEFLGEPHRTSAELAWENWGVGPAPSIADWLGTSDLEPALRYYRERAHSFLLALALRFEYAALFGWGFDDAGSDDKSGNTFYEITAQWGSLYSSGTSDSLRATQPGDPVPPAWLRAERAPGSVGHPAFADLPEWTPPAEWIPVDDYGRSRLAETWVPRVPAAYTALTWAAAPAETALIGYGPVLYLISRYAHGPDSAASLTAPALPSGAVFEPLEEGELQLRSGEGPHYLDRPGMPWPLLEGHYRYRVQGRDLLGNLSTSVAETVLRHYDDFTPPGPRARLVDFPLATHDGVGTPVELALTIDWDSREDFYGPDVNEFRVALQWAVSSTISLNIESVADVEGYPQYADLVVDLIGTAENRWAGALLSSPEGDFPIVSHRLGSDAAMRVRRPVNRRPKAGSAATVRVLGEQSPIRRVAKLSRKPAVVALVSSVVSTDPLTIMLRSPGSGSLPTDAKTGLYLHLLGATFRATRSGSQFVIEKPEAGDTARSAWDRWLALSDPAGAIRDSPAIFFRDHELPFSWTPPAELSAGLVTLWITASDAAEYMASPALPADTADLRGLTGNESARTQVPLSIRSTKPPEAPVVDVPADGIITWASSAASYAEDAQYELEWNVVLGAARYEVWRVLEGVVPGATAASTDAELRTAASGADVRFGLRSDRVFTSSYVDLIPGRAPTRALYKIRAIDDGGNAGAFSAVLGPVRVPDVRPPGSPNLLKVAAPATSTAERALVVEWSLSGPIDDVRFDVYVRNLDAGEKEFRLAATVARGETPGTGRRYTKTIEGLEPWARHECAVQAVREPLDPIDETGATRREIASPCSATLTGVPLRSSPLAAPSALSGSYSSSAGGVELGWSNGESYAEVEILRKAPERYGYESLGRIDGDATTYVDTGVATGTYLYRLRAFGRRGSVQGNSDAEVTVP